MKKIIPFLFVLPTLCLAQKDSDNKQTSVHPIFEFYSSFEKSDTPNVQRYLDKMIASGDMSFVNVALDANITLDNGMTFYIKSQPGEIQIIFDPRKNTTENTIKMKETCEAIKDIVSNR